jgi:hypothetical protein
MDDQDILQRIRALVEEEDGLHDHAVDRPLDDRQRQRLREVEEGLDQCWDLLRQRRARRSAGLDPDDAQARDIDTVEHYQQ